MEEMIWPSPEFMASARTKPEDYQRLYQQSLQDPDSFWANAASQLFWYEPWQKVLQWDPPQARWFSGGKTNLAYNALDRHLGTPRQDKAALIFEGEPGDTRTLTYAQLKQAVAKTAALLQDLGVAKGDRVCLYLPMIPEAAIFMLACARIGAIHSVVFAGFSAAALAERINHAGAKILVTADGGYRKGKVTPLKANADQALSECPEVNQVIVVRRTHEPVNMQPERDHYYDELLAQVTREAEAVPMEAEEPLFILYTSGSTGKPKGVLHTTGGYMTYAHLSFQTIFEPRESDVFFCTADVGWITGHTYVVYGPLLAGTTVFMYEGLPTHPDPGRIWQMIENHRVSILYTAPTSIRAFMKAGDSWPKQSDLSSLRLLGSVGEPINPEAWKWYYRVIGGERCPIVDTWWQTETGGAMITTLPGAHAMIPGHAGQPFFGVVPEIVDSEGQPVPAGETGTLLLTRPWPGMLRTLWRDQERYVAAYWSAFPGKYLAGDGARRDQDGNYQIIGRIDDVLNVSGHRIGTAEVESALVAHPAVAEAAVVGRPDPEKGEAIVAFVTLKDGQTASEALTDELRAQVTRAIGAIARPDQIQFTETMPKTRSGKIMRRFLRQIASGQETQGDTSTLEDAGVLHQLKNDYH